MEQITKEDLQQFRLLMIREIELIIKKMHKGSNEEPQDWIRSKAIRSMLNISPATLQNLRITGKIRYRKVLGSYYYNKSDLLKLFIDEK